MATINRIRAQTFEQTEALKAIRAAERIHGSMGTLFSQAGDMLAIDWDNYNVYEIERNGQWTRWVPKPDLE